MDRKFYNKIHNSLSENKLIDILLLNLILPFIFFFFLFSFKFILFFKNSYLNAIDCTLKIREEEKKLNLP